MLFISNDWWKENQTTIDSAHTSQKKTSSKSLQTLPEGESREKTEVSCTVGGGVNW